MLVPVFAVGRAQELLLMLEEHWHRTGIKVTFLHPPTAAQEGNRFARGVWLAPLFFSPFSRCLFTSAVAWRAEQTCTIAFSRTGQAHRWGKNFFCSKQKRKL